MLRMGYDMDMDEYHEQVQKDEHEKPYLKLHKGSLVTCHNLSIKKILWEYLLWILGGKPDNHKPIG
jgi:hypothetical protein